MPAVPSKKRPVGEFEVPKSQLTFYGMITGEPASQISQGRSAKNINCVDYGGYSKVRPGSRLYSDSIPSGTIYGKCDHKKAGVIVWQIGGSVYVSDKEMETFTEVLNVSSSTLTGYATIVPDGDDCIIASEGGIMRVVLDGDNYYMYAVNAPIPDTLITDVAKSATKVYGYYVIYSALKINGTGNRDRAGDDEIEWESGTCNPHTDDKEYGEVFFDTEIGADEAVNHVVGDLTLADGVNHATHFGVSRTKDIGENGVSASVEGIGNQADYVVWDVDVAVAQVFVGSITGNVLTLIVGVNEFRLHDAGSVLYDAAGNSGTIESYDSGTQVTLEAGHTLGTGDVLVAIGGGRIINGTQAGNEFTRTGGDTFAAADVGLPVFRIDGTTAYIEAYSDANTVTLSDSRFDLIPITLKPTVGNFTRKVNLITPDKPQGDGRISLNDRILSKSDLYIPRRYFDPIPSMNMLVIDSGFAILMQRDTSRYYYSQIGDKRYCLGYYRKTIQSRKIEAKARILIDSNGVTGIICSNKSYSLPLNNAVNAGRESVGEYVAMLQEPFVIHEEIGCYHWRSLRQIRPNVWFGLTSEPAFRTFDGNGWSVPNYAVDQQSGEDAVGPEIEAIDHTYEVVAAYTPQDGYLIWYKKYEYALCDAVIQNTGGTSLTGDDIWDDNGGTAVTGDDVIQTIGGEGCP